LEIGDEVAGSQELALNSCIGPGREELVLALQIAYEVEGVGGGGLVETICFPGAIEDTSLGLEQRGFDVHEWGDSRVVGPAESPLFLAGQEG
jgi:hypothetical protein